MKKILLFLTLLSSFSLSAIDECKMDVYFGNGILTKKKVANKNASLLEESIIEKFGIDYFNKHIVKVYSAYNRTDGFAIDMLESLVQKLNGTLVSALK